MKECAGHAFALLFTVSLTLTGASGAHALGNGSEETPYEIPEVTSGVRVDGVLDEEVWRDALSLELGYETSPGENIEPKARTEVLLASSRTHLYVAFRAYDPDPSMICANITDRDNMFDDDRLSFILDTFNDQHRSFMFFVNPYGIQGDALDSYGMGGGDPAWDTIWDSEGRITDEGFVVECAVPFSSLRFRRSDGPQVWGIGLGRKYSRDFDYRMSLTPSDRDETCYLCQVAKFRGFAGATPGRNIELDPTVSAVKTQTREEFPGGGFDNPDPEYDAGVTARWGVTPNLVVSGTVNPDFSQVEADAFQLEANTQFTLFYEEKRPFFLESSGAFDNFYTRSIASPIWAAKVTGKTGGNTFGAMVARDELTNLIISGSQWSSYAPLDMESTATAFRYGRDIGDMSNVSAFFNARQGEDYHNRVVGLETEVWFTENDKIEVQGEASYTQYPDAVLEDNEGQPEGEFSDQAYEIQVGRFTSGLDVYANYSDVGDDFRTDLAFMPRVGYKHAEAGAGHTWQRESGSWWTMLNLGGCYNYEEFQDGTRNTRGTNFWINHQGPKQSFADLNGWVGTKVFAGEEFDTWELDFDAGFWPSSSLFAFVVASYGEEVDYDNVRTGREFVIGPHVELKLGRALSAEIGHTYERFTVESDELYTANVSRLKAVYQFSRRMFVRGIVQYSDTNLNTDLYVDPDDVAAESTRMSSQVLLSYKINPQTVFFLGYSDSHRGDQDIDLTQSGRTLFAKIGYAWVL